MIERPIYDLDMISDNSAVHALFAHGFKNSSGNG